MHAKEIAKAIRLGQVVPLVGAGLSMDAGLPNWNDLGERLIRAWQDWEPAGGMRSLSPDNYIRLIRETFGKNDLAFISYLRRALPKAHRRGHGSAPSFSTLLYRALYSDPAEAGQFIYPQPSDLHRHLVALFADHPGRLWTTNYDDLLERAATNLGRECHSLDLIHHQVKRGLLVTHLHGFLPPLPLDVEPREEKVQAAVVLAEDDYHAVAANQFDAAWIGREFYRLFEEHRVLILGMSLVDANLRRVLATLPLPLAEADACHYGVLTPVTAAAVPLKRVRLPRRAAAARDASAIRARYWSDYGVGIVSLSSYARLLPFIMRLRYESFGKAAGDLWRRGAARGYGSIGPWADSQQALASQHLTKLIQSLRADFHVSNDREVVDLGVFLLHPDRLDLELTFRGGRSPRPVRGERWFRADPDHPTGVAGCVFVTGNGISISRADLLHDFGVPETQRSASASYEGIISVPLIDWPYQALPLGVIYVTVADLNGRLFAASQEQVLRWLGVAGQDLLAVLRSNGSERL